MSLVLNEEQIMLRDSAKGFLEEKAPVAALRQLRDNRDETGFSRELWKEMAEMGWAGIVIPEQYGGLEYGYTGLGLILEEMGKNLTVSPVVSSVLLGASAIIQGGTEEQKSNLLPAIAAGDLIVALALEEGNHHAPEKTRLSAEKTDTGYNLTGKKVFVLDGHVADKLIVAARTSADAGDTEGLSLFLVDATAPGISIERTIMADSRNAATVQFDNVSVAASDLLGEAEKGMSVLEPVLDIARIGLAAEMLGLCQQAFEITLGYLKERKQFGVLIGTFQGLQHRAAQLFCEIELCKSVVLKALQAIDEGADDLPVLASLAKAKLSEVVQKVTNEAIQMHGGIGVTDELDLGFYIKRARAAQITLGNYHYHVDRYARLSGF